MTVPIRIQNVMPGESVDGEHVVGDDPSLGFDEIQGRLKRAHIKDRFHGRAMGGWWRADFDGLGNPVGYRVDQDLFAIADKSNVAGGLNQGSGVKDGLVESGQTTDIDRKDATSALMARL